MALGPSYRLGHTCGAWSAAEACNPDGRGASHYHPAKAGGRAKAPAIEECLELLTSAGPDQLISSDTVCIIRNACSSDFPCDGPSLNTILEGEGEDDIKYGEIGEDTSPLA